MASKKSFPTPITILMGVIVLAAVGTWLLPAGQYHKLAASDKVFVLTTPSGETQLPFTQRTLDSLHIQIALQKFADGDIRKPVSIPGTFQPQAQSPQGLLAVLYAPLKGIYDSVDIILFILVIGSFVYVFTETGAILKGISYLSYRMQGREAWLIGVLTVTFSFLRASYGMEEEALVFYPILVPLFLAAGYDLLVPIAVIFGGTSVGGLSGFSNPFSTIIASNAAGINWMDGLWERLLLFGIGTTLYTWYLLRYAAKVKKDPTASLVYQLDGLVKPPYDLSISHDKKPQPLDTKTWLLIAIYILTFLIMIVGVVFDGWWTLEMSALFLGASILVAFITRMNEKVFVSEFIKGAESLLSVAFVVGVARGVTIILNEGHISDSILYYASILAQGMPSALLILLLLIFYFVFTLFISSSSGMAVLTMPIMGALAVLVQIPGREVVNAYLYGMNLMFFLSPTSLLLPSLSLVNVSVNAWVRFITPILITLFVLCAAFLVMGIYA
ncbi:MAG: YfcC family protein [Spirosomataceae bacterium]